MISNDDRKSPEYAPYGILDSESCQVETEVQTISRKRENSIEWDNKKEVESKRRQTERDEVLKNLPPPPSRTIYLGGINGPGAKQFGLQKAILRSTDILDHLRGMSVCKLPIIGIRMQAGKNCCFIDFGSQEEALTFFLRCYGGSDEPNRFYHERRIINVKGIELRVGWASQSHINQSVELGMRNGSTRCIYLHPVEAGAELALSRIIEPYGVIDTIRINGDKHCAFVHMETVQEAMHAVANINAQKRFKRVNFAQDRVTMHKKEDAPLQKPRLAETEQEDRRTVYLGGMPKGSTLNDLCSVIRAGGLILSIRIHDDSAFVSFVEIQTAASFHSYASQYGVILNGKRLSVGWGRSSKLGNNNGGNVVFI